MFHGRPEFEDIQPADDRYPADMPVFLLIGYDLSAPQAILQWADAAELRGQVDRARSAREQAARMLAWQGANPHLTKWPTDPTS